MAEDAGIRRENLNRLAAAKRWQQHDLAKAAGYGKPSYWHDLLKYDGKAFGEKAARRIEEALSLPRMWLDQPEANLSGLGHERSSAQEPVFTPPYGWPWSDELWQCVRKLDSSQLARAEAVLRAHLNLKD